MSEQASRSLWRRRLAFWLPALAFFLVNLVALAVYPVRFAGRAEVTAAELDEARAELGALADERRDLEAEVATIGRTRVAVASLYADRFSTESRRLTRVIAEVKELASRSGLSPSTVSYPQEPLEDYGLRRRSFVFSVQGSYPDLRKFINLLELSDTFLTLEQVGLSTASGGVLSIQVRISTLFANDERPPLEET
jgi:type IV pilus assembly protein PilO